MYASSDVNIVMMMFFELFLLGKISEFPSSISAFVGGDRGELTPTPPLSL